MENIGQYKMAKDGRIIRACGHVEYEGCCKKRIGHELHCKCEGRKFC